MLLELVSKFMDMDKGLFVLVLFVLNYVYNTYNWWTVM